MEYLEHHLDLLIPQLHLLLELLDVLALMQAGNVGRDGVLDALDLLLVGRGLDLLVELLDFFGRVCVVLAEIFIVNGRQLALLASAATFTAKLSIDDELIVITVLLVLLAGCLESTLGAAATVVVHVDISQIV